MNYIVNVKIPILNLKFCAMMIVLKSNNSNVSGETQHSHVEYNLNDPGLLPYLYSKDLISNNVEYYFNNVELLELQMEELFASAAFKYDDNLDIAGLNETQKKGLLGKMMVQNVLPEAYFELESLIRKIKRGADQGPITISEALIPYLLHPVKKLTKQEKIVLWHLLVHLKPYNPVMKYLFEKSGFYASFNHWPEKKQDWAVAELLKYRKLFYKLVE